MRVPRPLDVIEIRVLGSLLEKEQVTPEAYPLTVNQLVAACNQTSSRQPVMHLSEGDVREALQRLREHALVWRSPGARVERWEHCLDRRWELDSARKAVMAVLLLRGPQTPGELRTRCERMTAFTSPTAVEEVLRGLSAGEAPLVMELPRQPGHRETRWTHLVGEGQVPSPQGKNLLVEPQNRLEARVAELERRIAALERELAAQAAPRR